MTTAKNDELSVLGLKDTKRAVRRPDPKGSYSFSLPSVRPGVHPAEPALLFEFGTLWLRKRLPRQQTHHNTSVVFFLRGAASVPRRSAVALQSAKQVKSRTFQTNSKNIQQNQQPKANN